ncbi:MAG: MFS transporter, partial [Ilumatobacteraceae bacterium]
MPQTSSENSATTPQIKFPGMAVVAGGFLILTTSAGLGFYGLAVYLNALSKERGWDIASLSLGTTVFFVVSGVTGLGVARFIARRDARIVVLFGGVVGALSLLALGQI